MSGKEELIAKAQRLREGYGMIGTASAVQFWAETAADFIDCVLRYFETEKTN